MTMRRSTAGKVLGLPALIISGFLVATMFVGVSVATVGTTTSTSTTTTTTTTPTGGEGCTPGFWKNHPLDYPAPYTPGTTLGSVFTNLTGDLASLTFDEALSLGGGGIEALLRQAVAALLNATSDQVDYPLKAARVIRRTMTVIDRGRYEALKNVFDGFNNLTAPGFCE